MLLWQRFSLKIFFLKNKTIYVYYFTIKCHIFVEDAEDYIDYYCEATDIRMKCANVNDKITEEELMDLLQGFQGNQEDIDFQRKILYLFQ